MPINPALKHLYPPDWKAISQRIRFERAAGKCEGCGVAHNSIRAIDGIAYGPEAQAALRNVGFEIAGARIILTTAHLDHDPTNNAEGNLAALCQRCHLAHDLQHHWQSRRARVRAERLAMGERLLPF